MLIWPWLQENDEQTVDDEIPEASTHVSRGATPQTFSTWATAYRAMGLQENDVKKGKEEMPQASAKATN
jgi:hypothetical protein